MVEVVTELYIQLYWLLYRKLKNAQTIAVIDVLVLVILQLLNIYSIIVLIQKLVSINLTNFLFSKPLIIGVVCVIVALLNFFVARQAKNMLNVDDRDRYIRRRLVGYVIISIALFLIARFAIGG